MGNIDRKLVIAGLKELKGMKDFCIEEPQGLEGEGIWFHDVLDFCINSLEADEAYQLEYEKPSLDDFISWAKTRYGVTLIPKPSDEPDTYEKLFDNEKPEFCEDCVSRELAELALTGKDLPEDRNEYIALISKRIRELPSVLPKATKNDLEVEKIIDEIKKEFEKANIPIMDKLTLFVKTQNALYRCADMRGVKE